LFRNPAKLLSVLEQEIIPYIDQNYPSNKTRMYFGWQSGAIFGLHLFNQQPGQIELFLLASGQYYNGEQLGKTEQVLQNNPALKSNIYLNLGQMENHATAHHEALTGILKKHKNPNIKWHFSNSKRFAARSGHHTTPLESLTNGLEWYFSDFADLTFYSLEDIASFGGVKAVKDYYATRANRYQLSTDVSEHTKFSLFRYAAQANNYELFKHFEHQLGTYQVTGWYQFFGRFFLQNDDMDRAEEIYKDAVQKQPGTSIIWAELAEIYEKNHKYKLALKSYEKALELSMQVDESNAKYQQHILQLRSLITSR
jgi:tetratricopeptide (TPR) repeat protein